jgi:hypothetical protein
MIIIVLVLLWGYIDNQNKKEQSGQCAGAEDEYFA